MATESGLHGHYADPSSRRWRTFIVSALVGQLVLLTFVLAGGPVSLTAWQAEPAASNIVQAGLAGPPDLPLVPAAPPVDSGATLIVVADDEDFRDGFSSGAVRDALEAWIAATESDPDMDGIVVQVRNDSSVQILYASGAADAGLGALRSLTFQGYDRRPLMSLNMVLPLISSTPIGRVHVIASGRREEFSTADLGGVLRLIYVDGTPVRFHLLGACGRWRLALRLGPTDCEDLEEVASGAQQESLAANLAEGLLATR